MSKYSLEKYRESSDEEVLSLSISHPALFEILVDRYQDAFIRKVRGVINSKEEAEDVVQVTFTKIYLNAAKFRVQEGASFKSWGYKILMNTTFTQYQKLKKGRERVTTMDPEILHIMPDLNSRDFEKDSLRDLVVSAFSRMPRHLARALELHFLEGRSQKEVAEIEDTSVSAVKTRIYRAKKEFKKIIKATSI